MLSRLAGSVFHVGFAVERADVVARLLDVYVARTEPGGAGRDRAVAAELRSVVGAAGPADAVVGAAGPADAVVGTAGPADDAARTTTIDSLALDRHEPASIASSVAVARDHARRARDVVSTELWDCLDVTRSRMPRKVAVHRAHEFLGWVRERSALAIGVVEADASRDEVWEFFTLGRSLQRCATTGRLVASGLLDPESERSWAAVLRACGAGEAFHRGRDHHALAPEDAAAFLLLDGHSPRSLAFLARRTDECLSDVSPSGIEDAVHAFAATRADLEAVSRETALLATRVAGRRLAAAADQVVAALDERVFAAAEPVR